ncbi:MAG: threonine dehydratase [Alphaproteobacteria bacterium]
MPSLAQLEAAAAVVHETLTPTAQVCWPLISERSGCEVWVKHENHTPIGAFKVRGGLVYMKELLEAEPDLKGVITATRGNHGQSVAFAARHYGVKAIIVVPRGNSVEKNRAMRAFGGELVELGHDYTAAAEHAEGLARERGLHMLPSFHERLVCGVASYALELFRAVNDLDTVYVPIGLGSGMCGLIAARDALGLKTRIVGVVAEKAACYALSFAEGRPVATQSADTLADGMAVRKPSAEALEIILERGERVVTVSEEEILEAMGHYFADTHNLAEGAGAAALAALLKERDKMRGKKVGLILSGGNLDRDLYLRALKHA